MATKTRKKKTSLDSSLKAAAARLDKARTAKYPSPERVLVALLGWWGSIENEIGRVDDLLAKFTSVEDRFKYLPGFEFLKNASGELAAVQDALLHGRPVPFGRTSDELIEEVNEMLPAAEKGGAA